MSEIISIHSFRGGTGKSNLIANIAFAVASQGKRIGIVDTDIQSPGIHVIFGLEEDEFKYSINDYLWGKCSCKEAAYEVSKQLKKPDGTLEEIPGTMYLVPSSLKAGEIAKILREGYDVGLLNDGFQDLIEELELDYLFIDTHPGLNEETLLSIAISDVFVIIMRPDRQDFLGTAVTLEVAQKLDVPDMIMLVNKTPKNFDRQQVINQVSSEYNVPVAGLFQENEEMLELASSGIFLIHHPDHPFSHEIRTVVERLFRK